jgi:2-keto-4-pentenoate hydratase/2-oxohepta-3-ene-1,7-dioic acid hydratase in catechol pathway
MRIIRFQDGEGRIHFGTPHSDGHAMRLRGDIFGELSSTNEKVKIAKVLAPLEPRQIICVGLNYRRHAQETGAKIPEFPVLFMKTLNTVQHPGDPIRIPTHAMSTQVDYECELAVVIGRQCRNVSRSEAQSNVLGYTCANDVSARDWQINKGGGQWCRGKSFDTFCPLGPMLVTRDDIPDPNQLAISTIVNGARVQHWSTNDMIFDISTLIEAISASTTLFPGTVILTGTPHGVGMAAKPPRWLRAGDVVSIEIEGIGTLTNPVELETI